MQPLRLRVSQWITEHIKDHNINSEILSSKNQYFSFLIMGFCDEPEISLVITNVGLEWGNYAEVWDHPAIPTIKWIAKRKLSWESLNIFGIEEKMEKLIEAMLKAIDSKKREYLICRYCKKKMHKREFYSNFICDKCATEYLHLPPIVY